MIRLPAGLTALAIATGVLVLGAAPAAATALPLSSCTASSGVIVAVDFGHFGGPVERACGSTPTSGWQLLNQGGWRTDGTRTDGPDYVCRIAYSGFESGTAEPASFPCGSTPPANAYWSYWHAAPGVNAWTFSTTGAADTAPEPGSVDAWTFGAGQAPNFSPAEVRGYFSPAPSSAHPAPPPATRPGVAQSTPSSSRAIEQPAGQGSATAAGQTDPPGASSVAARATGDAGPSAASPSPTRTSASSASSATNAGQRIVDAQPRARAAVSGRNPFWGVLAAAVIALALAGLGGWQLLRRRSASRS